jgi:hypothetical protein
MSASRFQSSVRAPEKSLPLFERVSSIDPLPVGLNDDLLVRDVVTRSIKHSGHSREQIADIMAELLGVSVTARMITSFTAESKELHRWPGAWDRAFCFATGDDALLKCRAEAAGYRVIGKDEIKLLELGREYLRQKRATRSIAQLESDLEGVNL